MLQNEEEDGGFKFIVRLCHDVFLEVLIFGDRRRITKLERVGRRFHLSIGNFLKERPFLRLRLYELLVFNPPSKDFQAEICRFCRFSLMIKCTSLPKFEFAIILPEKYLLKVKCFKPIALSSFYTCFLTAN